MWLFKNLRALAYSTAQISRHVILKIRLLFWNPSFRSVGLNEFAWAVSEHAIGNVMLVAMFNIDRLWNSRWWPHGEPGVSSARLYWIQILLNKSKYEFNFKNLNIFHDFQFHSMCCSNVKFLKLEYFNNTSCVNMRMKTRLNM